LSWLMLHIRLAHPWAFALASMASGSVEVPVSWNEHSSPEAARRTWHDAPELQWAWPDAQHHPFKRSGGPGPLELWHGPGFRRARTICDLGLEAWGTILGVSDGPGVGKPDVPLGWLMLHIRLAHPRAFALDSQAS